MSMDEDEVDRRLARLRGAAEAATANLIELEDLGTLSLLRAGHRSGDYTGASAEPIAKALDDITMLNLHYGCFMRFKRDIEELRSEGRFTRDKARTIERLLSTPSITLPPKETDLERRQLFTPVERTEKVTPDQLVQLMNAEFVSSKEVVFQVDSLWRELLPALDHARVRLQRVAETAESLGERLPEQRELEARIQKCRDAVATDPLGAGSQVAADIDPAVTQLEQRLSELAAVRHGLAGELALARQQLATVVDAVSESNEARHASRRAVLDPRDLLEVDHRYLDDERTGLIPWLDRLDDLQTDGRWRDAQTGLRRWNERADQVLRIARQAIDTNRAPLARRDELRGLLSSYEVLARRAAESGSLARAAESGSLAELHRAAHETLSTEPVDLDRAAAQVRRYQEAVRQSEHA